MTTSSHDMTGMGMAGDSDTSGDSGMSGGVGAEPYIHDNYYPFIRLRDSGMSSNDEMSTAFLDDVVLVKSGLECDYFCRLEDDCIAAAFRDGFCRLYRQDQLAVTQDKGTTLFIKRPESKSSIIQLYALSL